MSFEHETCSFRAAYSERYEHLRTWQTDSFELRLFDTGRVDRHGKSFLAYEFFDGNFQGQKTPIFHGEDFCCSPLRAVDSDRTVAALLSFLCLRSGDTDAEYFADYSPLQLAWRDERAADLSWIVFELERQIQWMYWHAAGQTTEALLDIAHTGDATDVLEVLQVEVKEAIVVVAELAKDTERDDIRPLLKQLRERFDD